MGVERFSVLLGFGKLIWLSERQARLNDRFFRLQKIQGCGCDYGNSKDYSDAS
jgi:hypothetical protein